MKQKDVALILVISFMSAVMSLIVSNFLFKANEKNLDSHIVTAITTDFAEPNKKYFNENSINPTQTIQIGDNTNQQPFNQ